MFNIENIGKKVALIKQPQATKKQIYVSMTIEDDENDEVSRSFKGINLLDRKNPFFGSKFEVIPNFGLERVIAYCYGPSGSGKSYWSSSFIEKYLNHYKDRKLYVFSQIKDDPVILKFKDRAVIINIDLMMEDNDEFIAEDFTDSIVLFDDIDTICDKKTSNRLSEIISSILQLGRHYNVSCVITSHTACAIDKKRQKLISAESHYITYFPHGGNMKSNEYFLCTLSGMEKQVFDKLKKTKSRWITFYKNYIPYITTEYQIFKNNYDDGDE